MVRSEGLSVGLELASFPGDHHFSKVQASSYRGQTSGSE